MKTPRRRFLQSLAFAPVLGAGCVSHAPQRASRSLPGGSPRHIIHLVVDGMGSGILACADHFSQQTRERRLTWFNLLQQPGVQTGLMDMRSQDSLVTDSSAASSAWGSGVRIPNGKVNQTSAGKPLTTLYELLGEAGWARGLVTTTEITHATPAGFATCVPSRSNADEIAAQYLSRRIEVLLGGGSRYFNADTRGDKRDLKADYRQAGYAVLETPDDLKSAPHDRPWLGIFSSSHLPYLVDQVGGLAQTPPTPGLPDLTRRALEKLRHSERFILQVEGGRVDHACHANDAAGAIREMVAFDETLDVCLEFQRSNPGTLLVITTDHATGNPGLNGMGSGYRETPRLFRSLAGIRLSSGEMMRQLQRRQTAADRAAWLKEATGYDIPARRLEALAPFLASSGGYALYDGYRSGAAALAQVLANHTGISFTSTAHTSDMVPIIAHGPGAEAFRGFVECTQVFEHYLGFAGLKFRNPQEPLVAGITADPANAERVEEYFA